MRSFFEFLVKENDAQELARERPTDLINVKRNPAVEVRAPKAQRRLPETLDADQMASLLEIPAGDHFRHARPRDHGAAVFIRLAPR